MASTSIGAGQRKEQAHRSLLAFYSPRLAAAHKEKFARGAFLCPAPETEIGPPGSESATAKVAAVCVERTAKRALVDIPISSIKDDGVTALLSTKTLGVRI